MGILSTFSSAGNPFALASRGQAGHRLSVLFNDNGLGWKEGGITVAWHTVDALAVETTFNDNVVVPAGTKVLKPGQVVVPITLSGLVVDINVTGGAGTFTVTVNGQTTAGIAYNAAIATVEAAIEGLSTVGAGKGTVTGSAGDYTITFDPTLGNLAVSAAGAGGATATVLGVAGADQYGMYGPYDPAATDGRAVAPARGKCFIVPHLFTNEDESSPHFGVIEKANVYAERIIATTGAASLAAGPTWANLLAAMPGLFPKYDTQATYL